ncbi:MAG: PH domain-containing protein [Candidatus Kariarchaeaceae archaeon]|jgi:membrane protein YdbS with pleckstrin-like domain
METVKFTNLFNPDSKLKTKYNLQIRIIWLIITFMITAPTGLVFVLADVSGIVPLTIIFLTITVILYFISIWIAKYYIDSITYQISDSEVFVNKGVITKTNKIVPFRTITNIELHRGPFDRFFGLTTIDVQTAGASGSMMKPEEQLIGLPMKDALEIQQLLQLKIKKLQGTPGTTLDADFSEDKTLSILVDEVTQIRKLLETK